MEYALVHLLLAAGSCLRPCTISETHFRTPIKNFVVDLVIMRHGIAYELGKTIGYQI